MRRTPSGNSFFVQPTFFTCLLVALNVAVFGAMAIHAGSERLPIADLFYAGGVYDEAGARGEYWRFISYGFLHANLLHLTTNMLCLLLWGGHLERRIGPAYFLLVYAVALVGGGMVSAVAHDGLRILSVGASGAVSGVLGALFCLWILGRIELTASFFIINIGLNIALSVSASGIDWASHLGGFTAGLATCAALDLGERVGPRLFRCAFPEPVKLALLALAGLCIAALLTVFDTDRNAPMPLLSAVVLLLLLAIVKGTDLALAVRYGLAGVMLALALLNAAAAFAFIDFAGGGVCTGNPAFPALDVSCTHLTGVAALGAALMLLVCLAAPLSTIRKSVTDSGFLIPALRGARRRRTGL